MDDLFTTPVMVMSGPKLILSAMSGSVVLLQFLSVLMLLTSVATGALRNHTWKPEDSVVSVPYFTGPGIDDPATIRYCSRREGLDSQSRAALLTRERWPHSLPWVCHSPRQHTAVEPLLETQVNHL